jgi:hypothetical protein
MDKYVAEAEKILDEENDLIRRELNPRMNPAPEPISINCSEMKEYLLKALPHGFAVNISSHQTFSYLQHLVQVANSVAEESIQHYACELKQCENRIHAIESSLSWRITAPLRAMARIFIK